MIQRNFQKTLNEKASLDGLPEIQRVNAGDSLRPCPYVNLHGAQLPWKA